MKITTDTTYIVKTGDDVVAQTFKDLAQARQFQHKEELALAIASRLDEATSYSPEDFARVLAEHLKDNYYLIPKGTPFEILTRANLATTSDNLTAAKHILWLAQDEESERSNPGISQKFPLRNT